MYGNWKPFSDFCEGHKYTFNSLLSPSGDLGIGLVWDNNRTGPDHPTDVLVWLLKSSSNWTKLSMMGPQLLSLSGDLGIGLVWNNLSNPIHPTHFLVWLLETSSNWTKLSLMGPQLFSGWYQMIFRLGSDWVKFRFRLGSDYVQTRFSVGTE